MSQAIGYRTFFEISYLAEKKEKLAYWYPNNKQFWQPLLFSVDIHSLHVLGFHFELGHRKDILSTTLCCPLNDL